MMDRLVALQKDIAARAVAGWDVARLDRVSVTNIGNLAHVDFFGDPFGECFGELLDTLVDKSVANVLASLVLRGPDEGSNGTRNWDLTRLAQGSVSFPNLRHLVIEQTKPADHNRTIVASIYEENGVLAGILARAPALGVLVTPSAPNVEFFQVGQRPMEHLSVDTGYDHQGFIANLAKSSCFPNLRSFEFGEYNETYIDNFAAHVTPFSHYCELFQSPAFASVRVFQWRNPASSPAELAKVKSLTHGCQVLVVRWSAEWM